MVSIYFATKRIDNKDFRKLTYCRQFNWQPKSADGGDFKGHIKSVTMDGQLIVMHNKVLEDILTM